MTTLTGGEKQTKWADGIRSKMLTELESTLEMNLEEAGAELDRESYQAKWQALIGELEAIQAAAFWIDNRDFTAALAGLRELRGLVNRKERYIK